MIRACFILTIASAMAPPAVALEGDEHTQQTTRVASLKMEESSEEFVITSSNQPSWKIAISKKHGWATDLRIPADSAYDIIADHGWASGFVPAVSYWEPDHGSDVKKRFRHHFRYWKNEVTRIQVVEQTPYRVVLAIEGNGDQRYRFREHLIFEPTGVRGDQELVSISAPGVEFGFSILWFHGSVVNSSQPGKVSDGDSLPRSIPVYGFDEPGNLPEDIDYPFELRIPNQLTDDVDFVVRTVEVPKRITSRRQWSYPTQFGDKFGWTWLAFRCGDDPQRRVPREILPVGEPQHVSWLLEFVHRGQKSSFIGPHAPLFPEESVAQSADDG